MVAGGVHASTRPLETVTRAPFHVAVRGEGDEAITALAEGKSFERIPGLTWPEGETAVGALIEDLDTLPYGHQLLGAEMFVIEDDKLVARDPSIDNVMYPLGSCTMKYNPLANEVAAAIAGFSGAPPLLDAGRCQGALAVMKRVEEFLAAVTGLPCVTLHPAAGAQGELSALLVANAHFAARGDSARTKVLIPDSAHGTNPASAAVAGLEPVTVLSGEDGLIDVDDLEQKLGADTAVFMVTNPNTLGLFEPRIAEICAKVHAAGGLVYMDGANLNALMGIARPADFGVDMMHTNLHKTFSTPHGGGGPGAGPICVSEELGAYLPVPRVVEDERGFRLETDAPGSIGR